MEVIRSSRYCKLCSLKHIHTSFHNSWKFSFSYNNLISLLILSYAGKTHESVTRWIGKVPQRGPSHEARWGVHTHFYLKINAIQWKINIEEQSDLQQMKYFILLTFVGFIFLKETITATKCQQHKCIKKMKLEKFSMRI